VNVRIPLYVAPLSPWGNMLIINSFIPGFEKFRYTGSWDDPIHEDRYFGQEGG